MINIISVLKYSISDIQRKKFDRMLKMRQIICFPFPSLSTKCNDSDTQRKLAYEMVDKDLEEIFEKAWRDDI